MKHLHWKTSIFFLCSLLFLYVACSDGDQSGDVDLTGYVEAQALITNKILVNKIRYFKNIYSESSIENGTNVFERMPIGISWVYDSRIYTIFDAESSLCNCRLRR